MGLDNGIYIRNIDQYKIAKKHFDDLWFNEDICYWRNWWGFRTEVASVIDIKRHISLNDAPEVELDEELLQDMLDILKGYNKHSWLYASNRWKWKEVKFNVKRSKKEIKWLMKFKKAHPEAAIVFYDSY